MQRRLYIDEEHTALDIFPTAPPLRPSVVLVPLKIGIPDRNTLNMRQLASYVCIYIASGRFLGGRGCQENILDVKLLMSAVPQLFLFW